MLVEETVDIIQNATDGVPDDSDLPNESEIDVDMDHIMEYHHPSGGKVPKKINFQNG